MCTSWQTTYPQLLVTKRCLLLLIFFPIVHLIAWRKSVRTWSVYHFLILKEHIHFTWNSKFRLPINLIKAIYITFDSLVAGRRPQDTSFTPTYLIRQCRYIRVWKSSWDPWGLSYIWHPDGGLWFSMVGQWTEPFIYTLHAWQSGHGATSTYFLSAENLEEEVSKNCVMIWFLKALQSPLCWTFGTQRMLLWSGWVRPSER